VEWKSKIVQAENHDAETGAKPARATEMGERGEWNVGG